MKSALSLKVSLPKVLESEGRMADSAVAEMEIVI